VGTNRLIIYQQGHNGDFINGKKYIDRFLKHGFTVIAFAMPLLGMNNQPTIEFTEIGPILLTDHDKLKLLKYPLHYFLEPVAITLNYVDDAYNFDSIAMIGISGGGWTTILYSAIDPRITNSYPIAASLPLFLRDGSSEWGDFEQYESGLYKIANYLDLYILGATNGQQIQILNKYDPCCFGGKRHLVYERMITERAHKLGGEFSIFLDDTHTEHSISQRALDFIIQEIEQISTQ